MRWAQLTRGLSATSSPSSTPERISILESLMIPISTSRGSTSSPVRTKNHMPINNGNHRFDRQTLRALSFGCDHGNIGGHPWGKLLNDFGDSSIATTAL